MPLTWAHTGLLRRPAVTGAAAGGGGGGRSLRSLLGIWRRWRRRLGRALPSDATRGRARTGRAGLETYLAPSAEANSVVHSGKHAPPEDPAVTQK